MENRINIHEVEPTAFKGMFALEEYLAKTSITKKQIALLKIRASQINGCAYCIDMHTKEALKHGETMQRIFLLNAWKETNLFLEEEKTILTMTEEITLIHHKGLTEETYNHAKQLFGENGTAEIIMAIVTINAWNRIAISTLRQPGE